MTISWSSRTLTRYPGLASHPTHDAARRLLGRITWDPDRDGEVPLVVIDGRPFTWDEVGRMLMSFEGFTLRAGVDDTIEVVGGPLLHNDDAE